MASTILCLVAISCGPASSGDRGSQASAERHATTKDDAEFRVCIRRFLAVDADAAVRADLAAGSAAFYWQTGDEGIGFRPPGIRECSPVPGAAIRQHPAYVRYLAAFDKPGIFNAECAWAITAFAIKYNKQLAKSRPRVLRTACNAGSGAVDDTDQPTDFAAMWRRDPSSRPN